MYSKSRLVYNFSPVMESFVGKYGLKEQIRELSIAKIQVEIRQWHPGNYAKPENVISNSTT